MRKRFTICAGDPLRGPIRPRLRSSMMAGASRTPARIKSVTKLS